MENQFNEKLYLAANSDVLDCVNSGEFSSGKEHYQKFGKNEGRISNVSQFIHYQESQLRGVISEKNILQNRVNYLEAKLTGLESSKSWQITRPLRYLSERFRRFLELIQLYQKYRINNPGFKGGARMLFYVANSLQKGKWGSLLRKKSRHAAINQNLSKNRSPLIILGDQVTAGIELPNDIAVHAHVFYTDLVGDIRSYLERIPAKFKLYITTDSEKKLKEIERSLLGMKNLLELKILVSENRGRDIFPMLVTLGKELSKHEVVLHIHTKRSPHNAWLLGGWRRYMMEVLLGNSRRISAILQHFVEDKNLGILFPDPYYTVKPFINMVNDDNDVNIARLIKLAGKKKNESNNIDLKFFPAGDMFWFRGKAIKSFVDMGLSAEHFEAEDGQVNATMAHAIERVFPYFAAQQSLTTKAFLPMTFLSEECSAHEMWLMGDYIEKGLILKPILIFDHNIGGGSNRYSRELVLNFIDDNRSVIRIYNSDATWFAQWIGNSDGMLFYSHSIDELFRLLAFTHSPEIIINSLYGCTDLRDVISRILELSKALSANLDFKVHDFFSLCPSPHLSAYGGNYCGVPDNHDECNRCLKDNLSWYVEWYPKKNYVQDINEWRLPFEELLKASKTITCFDSTSIDILRRAFMIDDSKFRVVPHDASYFKSDRNIDLSGPLHIGVLGTLTPIKGGKIVQALSSWIDKHDLDIRITILGPNYMDLPPNINVHGPYEPNHLPDLVANNSINAVFAGSIVPETFGYAISEAMIMGLPIVAFDLGAQGARVAEYQMGKVVPLYSSPEFILTALKAALDAARERTQS